MNHALLYTASSLVGIYFLYRGNYVVGVALFLLGLHFWRLSQKKINEFVQQREEDALIWLSALKDLGVDLDLKDYSSTLDDISYNLDPVERESILLELKSLPSEDRKLYNQIIKVDPYGETFH